MLLTKLKNKGDAKKKKIEKMNFLKILKMDLLIGGAFFYSTSFSVLRFNKLVFIPSIHLIKIFNSLFTIPGSKLERLPTYSLVGIATNLPIDWSNIMCSTCVCHVCLTILITRDKRSSFFAKIAMTKKKVL